MGMNDVRSFFNAVRGTKTIAKGIGIHFSTHEDVCSSSVDQRHPAIRSIEEHKL